MNFIDLDIEFIIQQLERLNQETQPKWGKMSAQRMIEHLSDSVRISTGKSSFPLEIPEDRIGRMQDFLTSDKPMMKNVEVPFAAENTPLRHEEMALAIDELVLELIDFETITERMRKKQHFILIMVTSIMIYGFYSIKNILAITLHNLV